MTIAAPTASPQARIDSLSAEGRGVARIAGKTVFIEGALPGEQVTFRYLRRRGGHDEGVATALLVASPERVAPRCAHFGLCGGCSLQHLAPEAQLRHKEGVLMAQLAHIGGLHPARRLDSVAAEPWAYRRRARLRVRFVDKKGGVVVVERARENARRNRIDNAAFFSCDLSAPEAAGPVLRGAFERVVIDPPRVGVLGPIQALDHLNRVLRLVYVSCHPATLARDAKVLCAQHGFRLEAAGVFDMFPHTSHVEALALFVRG